MCIKLRAACSVLTGARKGLLPTVGCLSRVGVLPAVVRCYGTRTCSPWQLLVTRRRAPPRRACCRPAACLPRGPVVPAARTVPLRHATRRIPPPQRRLQFAACTRWHRARERSGCICAATDGTRQAGLGRQAGATLRRRSRRQTRIPREWTDQFRGRRQGPSRASGGSRFRDRSLILD